MQRPEIQDLPIIKEMIDKGLIGMQTVVPPTGRVFRLNTSHLNKKYYIAVLEHFIELVGYEEECLEFLDSPDDIKEYIDKHADLIDSNDSVFCGEWYTPILYEIEAKSKDEALEKYKVGDHKEIE